MKIAVTRPFPGTGLSLLRDSGHEIVMNPDDRQLPPPELAALCRGAQAVLPQLHDRFDGPIMDAIGPQLKVIANFAVGYNNIDVPAATQRSVVVCNTPGVLTEATADIAWTLLMGVMRRVHEGEKLVRSGQWENIGFSPSLLLGGELTGKTLAIIGAGRIGHAVARRAMGWDMRIVYSARQVHTDFERDFKASRVELDQALRQADVVSLHVPLTEQTRHLIGARELTLMKKSAYLINTARGPVVDEKALVDALKQGTIAGAGLDVYEDEPRLAPGLSECPNTLLLPHLGSATIATRSAMGELAARNLLNVLAGRRPAHPVNAELVDRLQLTGADA
jgi:glyoxylate reductase